MPDTPKGERTPEVRARAIAALAQGLSIEDAAEVAGVNRTTLWRWANGDEEFQKLREQARLQLVDGVVTQQVQALRALAPEAISALQSGLRASVAYELVKKTVTTVNEDGSKTTEDVWQLESVPDVSLAVRTADLVLKRIPEFAAKLDVQVSGSLEARLAELDAADAAGD